MQGRVLLILEVKVLIDYTFLSGAWLSDSWVLYHLFLKTELIRIELRTFNFNVDWWIINYFEYFIYDHEFKISIIVESTYNWLLQTTKYLTSTSYVYHYIKISCIFTCIMQHAVNLIMEFFPTCLMKISLFFQSKDN